MVGLWCYPFILKKFVFKLCFKTILTQKMCFNILPFDLHLEISKRLTDIDLGNLAQTCKSLSTNLSKDSIWKIKCLRVPSLVSSCSTSSNYLSLYKSIRLVPVYYCKETNHILDYIPFGMLKCSNLRNTNLLFASRLFSDSILIVVDHDFKYLWSICMIRNNVYHCKSGAGYQESTRCDDTRIGTEPLSCLWLTRNSDSRVRTILSKITGVCGLVSSHELDLRFYYDLTKLNRGRPKDISVYSGLATITGMNITFPTEQKFRVKLQELVKDGSSIIFCNSILISGEKCVQVGLLSLNNKVKFTSFK